MPIFNVANKIKHSEIQGSQNKYAKSKLVKKT